MKKYFHVQYILRYYEQKDYAFQIINAKSEDEALKKFAKLFGIKEPKRLKEPMFRWEDGEWFASFKCINEVKEIACPDCKGTGIIYLQ
ncbi:MAG: hypothetical protein KGZ58_01865 [Ignavibacteriales bacterium]|nr:hypothetical protein [Ignavibacteriales bacterium]